MAANWQIPTVENRDEELLQSLLQNQQIPVNNNNSDLVNALQNITQPVDQFAQNYIVDPLNKLGGGTGDSLKALVNFLPELSFGADVRDATQGSNQIIEGIKNKDISEALEGAAYMTAGIAGGIPVYGDVAKEAAQAAIPFMFGTARNLNLPKISDELVDAVTNANDLDNLGFYSPTERLAANLQPKGTGQQYLGILSKGDGQGSRIAEEMQDMGLDTWLQSKGKVSRDEVLDYIGENRLRYGQEKLSPPSRIAGATVEVGDDGMFIARDADGASIGMGGTPQGAMDDATRNLSRFDNRTGDSKYQQYSQSGGTNYQENLLTVPENKAKYYQKLQDVMDRYKTPLTDDEVARLSDLEGKFTPNTGDPMKNLELHLRYTRPDGALPNGATRAEWDEFNRLRIKKGKNDVVLSGDYNNFANPEEVKELRALREASGDNYQSPHYDPANIGLTTRTQSFNTNNGNSVHLMDELQSDWHSDGRTKGYRDEATQAPMLEWEEKYKSLTDESKKLSERMETDYLLYELEADPVKAEKLKYQARDFADKANQRKTQISREIQALGKRPLGGQVPNAPAKQSWMNQGIKKEINQTIADGKDYFAWTGGDIQADRYSLHHQVERIAYEKNADDTYKLYITPKGSTAALDEVSGQSMKNVKADQLEGIVGKEVAEKITKGKHTIKAQGHDFQDINILDGVDLKVGGEGMKGFYDKDVKKRTEKIIKRLDPKAKVEVIELDNGNKVWGVKITDQMRDKTKTEGMSMYSVAPVGVGVGGAAIASTLMNEKEKDYRNTPQTY